MNYNIGYHSYQDSRLVPTSYWAEEESNDLLTKTEIIAKYREEAVKALWECNASEKGFLTEEEIEESALILAIIHGENWI